MDKGGLYQDAAWLTIQGKQQNPTLRNMFILLLSL